MTRQSETTENRQLSDERHAIGWKVPTEPKRSWGGSILLGAIVALAIVVASVVGQWLAEVWK